MISWISYTTSLVSATHQGVGSTELNQKASWTENEGTEAFFKTRTNQGTIDQGATSYRDSTLNTGKNKTVYSNGSVKDFIYHDLHIVTENSTIFNVGQTGEFTNSAPLKTISQQTTELVNYNAFIATTSEVNTQVSFWTTQTQETSPENSRSSKFTTSQSQGKSTVQGFINSPRQSKKTKTFKTEAFKTYSATSGNVVVVEHTIAEWSTGNKHFYFIEFGEDGNSETTSKYFPITYFDLQSASRTTFSWKSTFSKAKETDQSAGIYGETYSLFEGQILWGSDSNTSPITHFASLKTRINRQIFPWRSEPNYDLNEDGEIYEKEISINSYETLAEIKSSYDNYRTIQTTVNSEDDTPININGARFTEQGNYVGKTNFQGPFYKTGEATSSQIYGAYSVFFSSNQLKPAVAEANLDFENIYSSYPIHLELEGESVLTLHDLDPENQGFVYNKLVSPLYETFSAYAKNSTFMQYDEEGSPIWSIDDNSSNWTTVQISRNGASFFSSYSWNVDFESKSSSSNSCSLKTAISVPVGISRVVANNATVFSPLNLVGVLGGRSFHNGKISEISYPGAFLFTTYNNSTSGTSSTSTSDWSNFTTHEKSQNADELTITVGIPLIRGAGHSIIIVPDE